MNYPNATKEQYIKALLEVRDASYFNSKKHPNNLLMLQIQCKADNQTITATQLAHAIGYDNHRAANAAYGRLAHFVADALGYTPPIRKYDGEPMWQMTLSSVNKPGDDTIGEHFEFVLHETLKDALVEMKWV